MIVYFTGTGNSRYCAQFLAQQLQEECRDVSSFLRNGVAGEWTSEQPWIFVAPTYSWQLPRVFVEWIRNSRFSGSREAYFVMTCGGDIGSAPEQNRALCAEKGLHCRGTLPVVMPDNYIVMFTAPSPEESEKIIAAARPTLEQCAACIREGRDFPPLHPGTMDRLKSGLVNTLFYRFQIKTKPFTVSNACISCGKCEAVCPLGNIHLENGRPVWGSRCTHCMACLSSCPTEAIDYGRSTRGKRRYQCPAYQRPDDGQS